MDFTKVHGNGNDFVVIDNRVEKLSAQKLAELAVAVCRRKFSIGADGILVIEGADNADFTMRLFNSDGSEGEMCGNGARAIARYAFENEIAGAKMSFMTKAGLIRAEVDSPYAELDMGELDLSAGIFGKCIKSHGMEFPFVFLTAGVPHCVLLVEDYDAISDELKTEIGREVSHNFELFPQGSNISFAQVLSPQKIRAVTYERGVEDLTASCGTGCVATAVAAGIVRGCEPSVSVVNPGGVNDVRLIFGADHRTCRAYLKGRTALVATGRILAEALL